MPRPPPADSITPALVRAHRVARSALASNLRRLRAERGLSQARLAERAALSLVYVTALEGLGEQNPTLTALASLAHGLGCTIDILVAPAAAPQRRPVGRPAAEAVVLQNRARRKP